MSAEPPNDGRTELNLGQYPFQVEWTEDFTGDSLELLVQLDSTSESDIEKLKQVINDWADTDMARSDDEGHIAYIDTESGEDVADGSYYFEAFVDMGPAGEDSLAALLTDLSSSKLPVKKVWLGQTIEGLREQG